jgi:regulator of sigma E protease
MFGSTVNIVLAALAIGILILVHELGHFFAAKAVGVRVEVFSVGFWKKLVGFKWGDTEYRLSFVPLGGYVKMAGEMQGEGTGAPDEFCSQEPWKRATILVAGVGMNMILAIAGFVLAFTIGVPFAVAEVGSLEKGWPAWEAGLRPGDAILRINGVDDPDFQDIQRQVALYGRDSVPVTVERAGEQMEYMLNPRYDENAGIKRVGFSPPVVPVVTGLGEVGEEGGRCPAREAGIELGDIVVSVNDKPIEYARDIRRALLRYSDGDVKLGIKRGNRTFSVVVTPEYLRRYVIGISGVSTRMVSLQGGGRAEQMGLEPGDEIASVNGRSVGSVVAVEDAIQGAWGRQMLTVVRRGSELVYEVEITDALELEDFLFSFECESSNVLCWVEEGSPAWEAGMRPGDRIVEIASQEVSSWEDILRTNSEAGQGSRMIGWMRRGRRMSAQVVPEYKKVGSSSHLGIFFDQMKSEVRKLGFTSAISTGFYKTYGTVADMFITVKAFVSREVSTRNVGGIVLIAYSSYRAAEQGMGKLLYLTAIISAALAFLNILPIPVLDGGHLLFLGIEKLQGRPVSEKVQGICQTIGLMLLLLLVAYAIKNDIMRLF